jgi:hypothetical protein
MIYQILLVLSKEVTYPAYKRTIIIQGYEESTAHNEGYHQSDSTEWIR